jgi:hypothetical protein
MPFICALVQGLARNSLCHFLFVDINCSDCTLIIGLLVGLPRFLCSIVQGLICVILFVCFLCTIVQGTICVLFAVSYLGLFLCSIVHKSP